MKLHDLIEKKIDELSEMNLSDALFVLSEMAEDDKLTYKEISIIEDMFDRLFNEVKDNDTFNEAEIVSHGDTEKKRSADFKKSSMTSRIKNRIYQRRYRKRPNVKMKAKKKALVQKRCRGKNMTAQLSGPGSSTYVCKLKNKFRSKLMKRVAKRYNS